MKLSAKVILIIAAVLLVAFAFSITTSLIALHQNQERNVSSFKQQFLELSKELFSNSSNLFFTALMLRVK